MSSIIKNGATFHGVCVCGRGVFTNDEYQYGRRTYVGQIRDGHACGLGVTTYDNGTKEFAEHGPDGEEHGRILTRYAGGTTGYERQTFSAACRRSTPKYTPTAPARTTTGPARRTNGAFLR